eukprot:3098361-Rhodomonas_salina.1
MVLNWLRWSGRDKSKSAGGATLDQLYSQARCNSIVLRAKAVDLAAASAGLFPVSQQKRTVESEDVQFVKWTDVMHDEDE